MRTQVAEPSQSQIEIAWQGECCIGSIAERLAELRAASLTNGAIVFDLSDVSKVDAAGLQLLVTFVMECERRKRPLTWRGTSLALREAATITGLRAALRLADDAQPQPP